MSNNEINRSIAPETELLQFDGFPAYTTENINHHFPCFRFENFNSEVVRLDFLIKSGSWIQDKPLQASSMARMMTEGTKQYTSFQIAETIDFSGAFFDVTASHHHTAISVYAVKQKLVSLFPIIQSMLTESVFPDEELKVILANNKQEFIIGNKKVMTIARRLFPSMLYGDKHPYGKTIQESDFDNINSTDLASFFQKLPLNGCSLYLGGNIDTDVISSLSEMLNHFNASTAVITENEYEVVPSEDKLKIIEIPDAVQSAIVMGLPVVGRSHPDFPLLMLTNTILGGYFGSRLMKSIREEKGFTYGISSGIVPRSKASHLSIQTEVKSEVTQQALDEIFKEISRLSTEKVPMEELNIARNYLFGSLLRSMDGPFALTERLMTIHAEGLSPEKYYRNYWDSISNASPENIMEIARKYLNIEKMSVLIVGNKK